MEPWELADDVLLHDCDWHATRASGPGGQKRNKTHSAIQIIHRPTGVMAHANESRLQGENRAVALQRLRLALVIALRRVIDLETYTPPPAVAAQRDGRGKVAVNPSNPHYLPIMAALLDLLHAYRGQVAPAAARLGISTTNFINLLHATPKVWTAAQAMRAQFLLPPLKA